MARDSTVRPVRAALALVLTLALAPAASARPVEIRGADPERYTLDLRFEDRGAGVLSGSERIEFVNRGPRALTRVWLRLWANGPDDCLPRRIRVQVEAPATAGAERVSCTALEVRLAAPVPPGGSGAISLRFEVRVRRVADRFGIVRGTVLLGNVIPVLAVRDQRGLHLEPYARRGESFYSLAAAWDAVLRLPRSLHAATTGATVSEEVSGEERTLRVASEQAREGGVQVRVFAGRKVRGSRGALRIARRAVRALSRRLTPYDSTELDVVLVRGGLGAGIGMEYPELVFSIPAADVITHEVAHQWWYGLVGNNQYLEPWLDESFAQYSHERLHPGVNFCLPRNPYLLVAPWRRHIPLDSTMELFERSAPVASAEIVYLAGSCALQRLQRDIGRNRMTAVLRRLQTRHRHGVMTRPDVLAAIRREAPRYPLRRWLRLAHLAR